MTPFQLCHFFVKADKELIKLRGTHGDKYHGWYKALGEHAQVASYESFSARELTTKQALDLLLVFKTACAPGHPASMAVTALASVIEKKRSDEEESRLAFRSSAPAASDSPDTQRRVSGARWSTSSWSAFERTALWRKIRFTGRNSWVWCRPPNKPAATTC